jgi:hypothetical protein
MHLKGTIYFSFTLFLLVTAFISSVVCQQPYKIELTLKDSLTSESLIGAALFIPELSEGSVSDGKGKSTFQLPAGKYTIKVSYLGYRQKEISIHVLKDTAFLFLLAPADLQLKEVVVQASRENTDAQGTQAGLSTLSSREIKALPALLGEKDPVRALQYIPGVQTVTDGDMGYYIRGGSPDQNLILFDNAVVYNPSHVLGFFSVFNNDVVDNVKLIKSGIPAEYGNRLSSVIDIQSPDSIPGQYGTNGNLGLISSKMKITGPLVSGHTAFYLAARVSYIDQLVKPLILGFSDNMASLYQNSTYSFYDINARIVSRITKNDRLSFSFYHGKDRFSMDDIYMNYGNKLNWGNRFGVLNWNHVSRRNWYGLTSLYYTDYHFTFDARQQQSSIGLFSGIEDIGLKTRMVKNISRHKIRFGFEYVRHVFRPNNIEASISDNPLKTSTNQKLFTHEGSLFIGTETDLTSSLRIDAGIRLTGFAQLGPFDQYIQNAVGEISDTIHYEKNEWIKGYAFAEPRLSGRLSLNEKSSLKFSFIYTCQYLHMATASSITIPADVWLPSSLYVEPQKGWQATLGYFRDFRQKSWSAYGDLYYKEQYNQIELLNGIVNDFSDNLFEQSMVFGKGRSFGLESLLKKNSGQLTGWIGYSLSRHIRLFDDINEGNIYPAKYDRRHDLKFAAVYTINPRWSVSGLFVLASGSAYTVPVDKYLLEGNIMSNHGAINSFRMPAYHRLDLSATRTLKSIGRFGSELVFSVFNVYNRPNPFYIYYFVSGDIAHYNLTVEARQICVFPILPSISWSFKF